MKKNQIEIPGSSNELEIALDDICDRLEEIDKFKENVKEIIQPAKARLAKVMMQHRKEKIFHRGRHFNISSPDLEPKLRITKQREF